MSLRAFKMPDDIPTLLALLPPSFQYPENPDWNFASDELEEMMDTLKTVKSLWPLLSVVMVFIPKMRDIMLGYLWEEDGKAVGVCNTGREGMGDTWFVGNVGVLPEHRRKGIARKVVEACVALAREKGAKTIVLDVIAGNLPAYTLYDSLGFETYGSEHELIYEKNIIPPECPIPEGFTISPYPFFDWRTRFDLASRITPPVVKKYNPVTEARFQQPPILRIIGLLIRKISGSRQETFIIRRSSDQQVVGTMRYSARKKQGGINSINISLDPAYGQLAAYAIGEMMRNALIQSPGRRISMECPGWQPAILDAALSVGFTTRFEFKKMGMVLP